MKSSLLKEYEIEIEDYFAKLNGVRSPLVDADELKKLDSRGE